MNKRPKKVIIKSIERNGLRMKGKKTTWKKARHAFYYKLSCLLVGIYVKIVYRYRGKKFDDGGRQYLYIFNHQTPLDQHLL